MDLLAKRYADPFLMLDNFIRIGQLHEFSLEIMKTISEEQEQDIRWEFFLHKVWDMTFEEYIASCTEKKDEKKETIMPKEEAVKIIEKSSGILEGFTAYSYEYKDRTSTRFACAFFMHKRGGESFWNFLSCSVQLL